MSDGAVSYYLDRYVRSRIARFSYGQIIAVLYDSNDLAHVGRADQCVTWADGTVRVNDYFNTMISKVNPFLFRSRTRYLNFTQGTQISEQKEFEMNLYNIYNNTKEMGDRVLESEIWCYKGEYDDASWLDIDRGES